MTNLADLIPAGGGQNNTDFVADGTIASGKPVVLTAAGKASEVGYTARSDSLGSETALNGAYSVQGDSVMAHDTVNNKLLYVFGDMENSQHGYARVVTISGSTVTVGTKALFFNAAGYQGGSVVCIGSNKFFIAYTADVGGYLYGRVASVSGTTVTFGTQLVIASAATNLSKQGLAYSPTTDAIVLLANYSSANFLWRFTVSGTTITDDTAATTSLTSVLNDGGCSSLSCQIVRNTTTDEFFVAWKKDGGTTAYGGVIEMAAGGGGSAFTGGSAVLFTSDLKDMGGLTWDSTNDRYVVVYQHDNDYQYYSVASTSSGVTTWGATTAFVSVTGSAAFLSFDQSVSKVVTTVSSDSSPYARKYTTGVVSGTSTTWATPATLTAGVSSNFFTLYDSALGKTLLLYVRSSVSYLVIFEVGGNVTSLTSTNLLGLAAGAISDTATGTINTWGSRNEVQTSLTIGSDYYVQADGTLSTTSTSPAQLIGTAITATQINIKDYTG